MSRDRPGRHPVDARGAGGDPADEHKPYEFGDPFLLDLREPMDMLNMDELQAPAK